MGYDLKTMTAKQALYLAKLQSGKTCEEIAEATGFPYQCIRQYFKENETSYFPGLHRIPGLCKALGNDIIIKWILAQLNEETQEPGTTFSNIPELLKEVNNLTSEMGDVASQVSEAIEDNLIDQTEAQKIRGELNDVIEQCQKLKDGLRKLANQATSKRYISLK